MQQLEDVLKPLSEHHQRLLKWFIEHANSEQSWAQIASHSDYLTSKPKGIYKPKGSKYALSVKQMLNSPYADRNPIYDSDGTWSYSYFQENEIVSERDKEFTNRSLMACLQDNVPIGVMRQISGKPDARYHILGVALVAGWEGGYFFLEGFSPSGRSYGKGPRAEIETLTADSDVDDFYPLDDLDGRKRVLATLVQRQGQREFRHNLIDAYGCCAVSRCDVVEALEAAHITPYRGPDTNRLSNGLLLRADLHSLFDLGLLTVDSASMTVLLSAKLASTVYSEWAGKPLHLPVKEHTKPNREALDAHRKWAGL